MVVILHFREQRQQMAEQAEDCPILAQPGQAVQEEPEEHSRVVVVQRGTWRHDGGGGGGSAGTSSNGNTATSGTGATAVTGGGQEAQARPKPEATELHQVAAEPEAADQQVPVLTEETEQQVR